MMEKEEPLPSLEGDLSLLLSELSKEPAYPVPVFERLEGLMGFSPVPEEHFGKYKLMISDWLEWGRESGYVKEDPEEEAAMTEPSGNPLIAVLERIDSRLVAIEVRQEEIGEGFKRLMGILNMLATNMAENRKPWSERNGSPDAVLVDDEETDRINAVSSHAAARPAPRPSPPVVRGGRVYN